MEIQYLKMNKLSENAREKIALRAKIRDETRLRETLRCIFIDTESFITHVNKKQREMRDRYERLCKKQREINKTVEESIFKEPLEWVDECEVRSRIERLREENYRNEFPCPTEHLQEVMIRERLHSRKDNVDLKTRNNMVLPPRSSQKRILFLTENRGNNAQNLRRPNEKDEDVLRLERKTESRQYKPNADQRPIQAIKTLDRVVPKFVAVRVPTPSQRAVTPATSNLLQDKNGGDRKFHVRLIAWRKKKEDKKFGVLEVKIGKFLGESEKEILKRHEKNQFLRQTELPAMKLKRSGTAFF